MISRFWSNRASLIYGRLLALWLSWVIRHARFVTFLALSLTTLISIYVFQNFAINSSTTDMLSKDLPFRQNSERIDDAFPQMVSNLVIVIEGQTADIADDAAIVLSRALRRDQALYHSVYNPKSESFFRRNGLLYLDVDEIYDLSDKLAEIQPFLGTIWRDPNLRGFFKILGLSIDQWIKAPGDGFLRLEGILDAAADVADAQLAGRFHSLSWTSLIAGENGSLDDRRRFIVVKPVRDHESLQPAEAAIDEIRKLSLDLDLSPEQGVSVRLTGAVALEEEELESVEKGMGAAAIISFVLVMGLLFLGLRQAGIVAACLVTLLAGLIWTTGFAIWAVGALNLLSVAFAVLFIGLSIDFGIHFALRYKEILRNGFNQFDALAETARGVGGAMTLCAASAAIAFYAFLPTKYDGLAELGLIAGTGMFIALFANLTVLPALIVSCISFPSVSDANAPSSIFGDKNWDRIFRRSKWICSSALILVVAALFVIPKASFDFDPLNLKDPTTESVSTLTDLIADGSLDHHTIEILAPNLEVADSLAERLRNLSAVGEVETLSNFIPANQDIKLSVIQDLGLIIGPTISNVAEAQNLQNKDRIEEWSRLSDKLSLLARVNAGSLGVSAKRLQKMCSRLIESQAGGAALMEFEKRLLTGLLGRLDGLRQSLEAKRVALNTLPIALRNRLVSKDGRALIKVRPKSNLKDRQALEAFVRAVQSVSPGAAGAPVVILEAGQAVIGAFLQALALAVSGVAILLWLVLGNLREVGLVFAPLVLASLLTAAGVTLFGLNFNLANVIVLPLLFGLGVAGGIHILERNRFESGVDETFQTSTPRAVLFSALTTIGSFGSISISAHPGTSSMGVLLMFALAMSLLSTLVFLPALLSLIQGSHRSRKI